MALDNFARTDESVSLETEQLDDSQTMLVWKPDGDGARDLVGFSHPEGLDAIDWAAVRAELARRGLGVGAIHHKDAIGPDQL